MSAPAPAPIPVPVPAVDNAHSSVEAVDRYEGAVALRAQVETSENDARVAAARRDLLAEPTRLTEKSRAANRAFKQTLDTYIETGTRLIDLADQRRTTIEAYSAGLKSLSVRLERSVDKSWKILGRVVARQGLLRLRSRHEELQSRFAALVGTDSLDPTAIDSVIQAEMEFQQTLVENERGFVRAEGREWVDEIRSNLDRLVSLRATLVAGWETLSTIQGEFQNSRRRAREAVQPVANTRTSVGAPTSKPLKEPASVPASFVGPPVLAPFVGPPVFARVPMTDVPKPETRVSRQETDSAKQKLVAWLTGGVLIIVLVISIETVRSIVVPIRRLLSATSRLGKNGTYEPVPRGGIKGTQHARAVFQSDGGRNSRCEAERKRTSVAARRACERADPPASGARRL